MTSNTTEQTNFSAGPGSVADLSAQIRAGTLNPTPEEDYRLYLEEGRACLLLGAVAREELDHGLVSLGGGGPQRTDTF